MRGGEKSMGLMNLAVLLVGVALILGSALVVYAQQEGSEVTAKSIGAAIAVGVAGLGAGMAIASAGAAAASALAEKREIAGTLLIIVALAEGIAIYGLLVALFIILIL